MYVSTRARTHSYHNNGSPSMFVAEYNMPNSLLVFSPFLLSFINSFCNILVTRSPELPELRSGLFKVILITSVPLTKPLTKSLFQYLHYLTALDFIFNANYFHKIGLFTSSNTL